MDLVRSKRSFILAKVIASLIRISVAANRTLEINLVAYVQFLLLVPFCDVPIALRCLQ